jgi:hypothetical protein
MINTIHVHPTQINMVFADEVRETLGLAPLRFNASP